MPIRNYQDLDAWNRSMDLVDLIYRLTKSWPKEELFGLTAQIRRAAISVPSNIAEGQGRRSDRDYVRFLNIAHGSLRELETQSMIAARLGYVSQDDLSAVLSLAGEAGRLTMGLANSIANS